MTGEIGLYTSTRDADVMQFILNDQKRKVLKVPFKSVQQVYTYVDY